MIIATVLVAGKSRPPKTPPEELVDAYTLDNRIPMEYFYVDDTSAGEATHYTFPVASMLMYLQGANKTMAKFNRIMMQFESKGVKFENVVAQFPKDDWIYFTLLKRSAEGVALYGSAFEDASVAVLGSTQPWVESLALHLGAQRVTTVEYNYLTYDHPDIETIAYNRFNELYDCGGKYVGTFDIVVSISSLDHDGLGR